jgi:hypothetical protein
LALDAVQTALHGLSVANEWQHAIPNALGIETNSFVCANRFFQFLRDVICEDGIFASVCGKGPHFEADVFI